jgi:hypothetical protein
MLTAPPYHYLPDGRIADVALPTGEVFTVDGPTGTREGPPASPSRFWAQYQRKSGSDSVREGPSSSFEVPQSVADILRQLFDWLPPQPESSPPPPPEADG